LLTLSPSTIFLSAKLNEAMGFVNKSITYMPMMKVKSKGRKYNMTKNEQKGPPIPV